MTRNELYKAVSKASGIREKDVREVGNVIFDTIKDTVCSGDKVSVMHFGVFEPKRYDAHGYYNPLTKQHDELPERVVPKFSPAQAFKDGCNV